MPNNKSRANQVKATDLKPDELAKAIEESVQTGKAKAAVAKSATPTNTKSNGTKIEVKRHSSAYISQRPAANSEPSVAAAKPSGAAAPGKQTSGNSDEPQLSHSGKTLRPATLAKAKEARVAEAEPADAASNLTAPSSPGATDSRSAADAGSNSKEPAKANPSKASSSSVTSQTGIEPEAKTQNPKVFDTNKYHLPIKPRSRHYLSDSVAWAILTLFVLAVAGYLLVQLEIVDPKQFGL